MILSPSPVQQFFDNNGRPLDGGLLFTYVAGTTTKIATYKDSTGGTPNTNPIVLDYRGEANVWLDPTLTYKFTLSPAGDTDPPTKPIWTVDNISAGITYASITRLLLGQILYPQSAAELAAGVTPLNYFWPWGWLDRYLTNTSPGLTDMTSAWVAANAQSAQGGWPIFVQCGGSYAFASAITVDYRSDVQSDEGAIITYTGSSDIAFLTIGDAVNVAQYRNYNLPMVRRANQSNWSSEANIGIKFLNISNSPLIRIPQVNGFTLGVQTLPAGGNGFQFNKDIELGHLINNKIGVDLSNQTAGYTNENNFRGGRFSVNSGVNNTLARYAVRITSSDGTYLTNNNNTFTEPSFELNALDTSGEAVPILMTNGVQNHFLRCRDEGNDTPFARESNASSENSYDVGYSNYVTLPVIECNSSAPNFLVTNSRSQVLQRPTRVIYNSGPMHKRACYYDGATNVHVPNVAISNIGSTAVTAQGANITFNANYLQFANTYFPSVFVDTSNVKQFVVSKDVEIGFGGRVAVQCYDAAGAIITTNGSCKGTLYNPFSVGVSANFGNVFQLGSDSEDDVFFMVTSEVKSVRVIIFGADANLRIRAFEIVALNCLNHEACWTGYEEVIPGANIGTAAPTAGTWDVGRLVLQAVPTVGQPKAWVCTVSGTPGTWVSQGNL